MTGAGLFFAAPVHAAMPVLKDGCVRPTIGGTLNETKHGNRTL